MGDELHTEWDSQLREWMRSQEQRYGLNGLASFCSFCCSIVFSGGFISALFFGAFFFTAIFIREESQASSNSGLICLWSVVAGTLTFSLKKWLWRGKETYEKVRREWLNHHPEPATIYHSEPDIPTAKCPRCGGSGVVTVEGPYVEGGGPTYFTETCPDCSGNGQIDRKVRDAYDMLYEQQRATESMWRMWSQERERWSKQPEQKRRGRPRSTWGRYSELMGIICSVLTSVSPFLAFGVVYLETHSFWPSAYSAFVTWIPCFLTTIICIKLSDFDETLTRRAQQEILKGWDRMHPEPAKVLSWNSDLLAMARKQVRCDRLTAYYQTKQAATGSEIGAARF